VDVALTVYQSLLARGYFPKELPPAFSTEQFAKFAASKSGRKLLAKYAPADNFTECFKYRLALPGLDRRELRVPHPASFSMLADLTSKNLGRLLKKSGGSGFSKSRPIYETGKYRAILPMTKPTNLGREKAAIRAGSSFLLKTDISQFYPSLYTHAVGWAVDPKLKKKAHWKDWKLLGKKIDQYLMNLDGKVSQGIPIGNDISFLLAEVVLAQVDRAARLAPDRSYRWFDDYELAFDTMDEAEGALKRLNKELAMFKLRLNSKKTKIVRLPQPAQDEWQEILKQASQGRFTNPQEMVKYFDAAFRLREEHPDVSILLYALGILFKVVRPNSYVGRIAQSCITQCLLCEPGAAQKAFSLLTFWQLNGLVLDAQLLTNTVNQMIVRHQASGFSSDIAWALAFCLEQGYALSSKAGQALSVFDDDCIALQALHMEKAGLLPKGFKNSQIARGLKEADLDREHWLIAYETVRQGFLAVCEPAVKNNVLFAELLKRNVAFYRTKLPLYSSIIHPGGAPEWVVKRWIGFLTGSVELPSEQLSTQESTVFKLIGADLAKVGTTAASTDDALLDLLKLFGAEAEPTAEDTYSALS
jgi:hypothetical protein